MTVAELKDKCSLLKLVSIASRDECMVFRSKICIFVATSVYLTTGVVCQCLVSVPSEKGKQ